MPGRGTRTKSSSQSITTGFATKNVTYEKNRMFALTLPFDDLDSELALELAALPAELAGCRRGGVVASADCDLCGFWDFGVVNFGALKRAISFFNSVFFACTPCKVSFVMSFSRTFLSNSF